ncbi:adenine deaminase C-terminal domain-containing protein [Chloroflexota bacterium]
MPGLSRYTYDEEQARQLMKVALGEVEADLAIVNGDIVNVYTGEVITGETVLIKGNRIAYVGQNAEKSIGSKTQLIDAERKTLIPGMIDGHTHANFIYSISELIRYALPDGTTGVITEAIDFAVNWGYPGIIEFLKSIKNQPMKIYLTLPAWTTTNSISKEQALSMDKLRRLLKRKEVVGLGECYWGPVTEGEPQVLDYIAATRESGKKIDGHTTGAKDNKLQGYAALGISSCHEPTTVEEVMERLRLGMFVMIREGETRRELEAVAAIKDEQVDFRQLGFSTDGIGPWQITTDGYMAFVVQKAIDLGFDPVTAIQMATLNTAQHFGLDDFIGGIAPGKCADIVIIPDLTTIKAEYVISNGQVVARNGELLVQPRKHRFPRSLQDNIRLPRKLRADDLAVRVDDIRHEVKLRVIDQVTELVTREAVIGMPVVQGQVSLDVNSDILKLAAIERTFIPGKTFVGFIRGIGLKRGAIATSVVWDTTDIIAVGASEADMAQAVNRVVEMKGGMVICADGEILAEMSMPLSGMLSLQPVEIIGQQLTQIQQAASSIGCPWPDIRLTLCILTTGAIPFLRVCEDGLFDLRQNGLVSLMVD